MKKVRIMLAAVIIFAAVGGALAFKAKKGGAFCLDGTGACPFNATLTIIANPNPVATSCTDTPPASPADCNVQAYQE
jgi:hypothetical protein